MELPAAFDLSFVFNQWTLGQDFCNRDLGAELEELSDPGFNMLRHLGFTDQQIQEANDYVPGR